VFGVIQDPGHNFSRWTVLEETDRQPLECSKHLNVQIVDNLLFKTIVELDSDRSTDVAQHIGTSETAKHDGQQLSSPSLNYIVDQNLDEPRRYQFERRRQPGKDKGTDDHRTMRTKILKDSQ
jgi:hypothetical protein